MDTDPTIIAGFQLFITVTFLISIVSLWGIFSKVNIRPWYSLIPIFREYVLTKLILGKGLLFILLFIPIIGSFFCLYLSFQIGKSFGKSTLYCVLCALVPFIFILFLAFDSSTFQGKYHYYDDENQNPYK